ncbi:hypothetical protein ACIA58_32530 [Kribbella sp. NPDC051586]|uniref:hypothetical protein n=1 Tax=Kribbella sp. NPDC051586 TaxID=3364118 RepID=UPI0037A39E21
MAEEESAEHYLQVLAGHARQLYQWMRSVEQRVRQQFTNQQQRRALIEDGNSRRSWDRNLDVATRDMDPRDRTRGYEQTASDVRAAEELQAGNRGLEQQRQALQAEVDGAQQQLDQQAAQLNNDRDRDGIPDDIENRTDFDRDHRNDATQRRDEIDEQNDRAHDQDGDGVDDGVEDREAQQARDDEDRRKQQEEERRRNQESEEGVDVVDAAPAAVGAAATAEALDDELDQERADDLETQDPSAEADNLRQAETDAAEQDGVDPSAAEQTGLDANDRLQQDNLDQQPEVDAQQDGLNPDATEQAGLDNDLQQDNSTTPQTAEDNALDSSTLDAEQQTDLTQDQQAPAQDQQVDGQDQQLSGRDQQVPAQDQQLDGQDQQLDGRDQPEPAADEQLSGQDQEVSEQDPQVDGQDQHLSGEGQQVPAQDQQLSGQEQQVPEQQPPQVEAPEQGQQQAQASEQGMGEQPNQTGQRPTGPNTQQIANASQSAVDETAGLGSDDQGQGQGQGGQESQGQRTQRPPAEEPILDEHRQDRANGQSQTQPGNEIPPNERATLDRSQEGYAPAALATRDSGGVATSARPGTAAQQRSQDRSRNDRPQGAGPREP